MTLELLLADFPGRLRIAKPQSTAGNSISIPATLATFRAAKPASTKRPAR